MDPSSEQAHEPLLLFDLGNVVFDIDFARVFARWAEWSGGDAQRIEHAFGQLHEHDAFERGELRPAAFREALRKRLGLRLTDEELDRGWCDLYLDEFPGIDELLTTLGRRARIAAFTNTNAIHEPVWRARYAHVLRHFEAIHCSHHLGARKPEPQAFAQVLGLLGARASDVLFLDDNEANVAGARSCGIRTIHVTSQEAMREGLRRSGWL